VKKGDIAINEVTLGIGALILIFVVLMIGIGISGGYSGFTEWFEKLFGIENPGEDYTIAKASSEGLICALNSVAGMNVLDCAHSPQFSLASHNFGSLGAYAIVSFQDMEPDDTSVSCTTEDIKCCKADMGSTRYEWLSQSECGQAGGHEFAGPEDQVPPCLGSANGRMCCVITDMTNPEYKWDYECNGNFREYNSFDCEKELGEKKERVICTVKNFKLPESFAGGIFPEAKEYIAGYGDPTFLLYYQTFPQGEDGSWSSFSTWFDGVGYVVLWAIPVSKILKPIFSGTKAGFTALSSTLKNPVKSGTVAGRFVKGVYTKFKAGQEVKAIANALKEEDIILTEAGIDMTTKSTIFSTIYKRKLNEYVIKYFESKGGVSAYKNSLDPAIIKEFTQNVGGTTVLKAEFENALEAAYTKAAAGGVSDIEAEVAKSQFDLYKYMNLEAKREISEQYFQGVSYDVIQKTLKRTGLVATTALLAAKMECDEIKNENHPNKLVLQSALKCSNNEVIQEPVLKLTKKAPEPGINLLELAKPIVLDKSGFDDASPFYLVSPCYAYLNVEDTKVKCSAYTYNMLDGTMECDKPDIIDFDDDTISCGISNDISSHEEVYNKIENLISSDKTFVEYSSTGEVSKINLFNINGYLDNMQKVTCSDSYYKLCYTAERYEDGQLKETMNVECSDLPTYSGLAGIFFEDESPETYGDTVSLEPTMGGVINPSDPSDYFEGFIGEVQGTPEEPYLCYLRYDGQLREYLFFNRLSEKYIGVLYKIESGKVVGMFDSDTDGKWDYMGIDVGGADPFGILPNIMHFSDNSNDGKIDFIKAYDCSVPGIKVSVDKEAMNSYLAQNNIDHNYCYTYVPAWKVVASKVVLVGAIAIGSVLEGMSAGTGTLIVAGLIQGAIAYSVEPTPTEWPGPKINN